jgi:hypothetical protein
MGKCSLPLGQTQFELTSVPRSVRFARRSPDPGTIGGIKEIRSGVVITSDNRSGGGGEVTEMVDLREIVASHLLLIWLLQQAQ